MVNTLLKSMRMMTDVLILTLFFIAIFALIGLQLFIGSLRSRCVPTDRNISVFNKAFYSNSREQTLLYVILTVKTAPPKQLGHSTHLSISICNI